MKTTTLTIRTTATLKITMLLPMSMTVKAPMSMTMKATMSLQMPMTMSMTVQISMTMSMSTSLTDKIYSRGNITLHLRIWKYPQQKIVHFYLRSHFLRLIFFKVLQNLLFCLKKMMSISLFWNLDSLQKFNFLKKQKTKFLKHSVVNCHWYPSYYSL